MKRVRKLRVYRQTNFKRLGIELPFHASTDTVPFRGEIIFSKAYFFTILKWDTLFPRI
jgi:hypothetical protein